MNMESERKLPAAAEQTQLILVVEDNEDDFLSVERVLRRAGLANRLKHVSRGEEALAHLEAAAADPDQVDLPGMVLLDLGLPGMDGSELLQAMRANPKLQRIPVVVITQTSDQRDLDACRALGANAYVQKPIDVFGFMLALQRLDNHRFELRMLRA